MSSAYSGTSSMTVSLSKGLFSDNVSRVVSRTIGEAAKYVSLSRHFIKSIYLIKTFYTTNGSGFSTNYINLCFD